MDRVEAVNIAGDSTFALLLEAQKRGHEIFYYTPEELSWCAGDVVATGHALSVFDKEGAHFQLGERQRVRLADVDAVLLRQDPPFDMAYLTTTYLLERIHLQTLVVNDPAQVRDAPEKLFVLDFLDLMPPTIVTRSMDEVLSFRDTYRDIIVKPLYGNGGASVFRIREGDSNLSALVEMFQETWREPFMVQQFRDEIAQGDKRVILVDGEVAGAINRIPADGEARSNLGVGGRAEPVELTARDREICARLAPELKRRGLIFTGIDIIGPYLTEINVTSPTGIRQVQEFGGADIAAMIFDVIETKTGRD